jgi:YD repeat-containing protein
LSTAITYNGHSQATSIARTGSGTVTHVYNSAARLTSSDFAGASASYGLDLGTRTFTNTSPRAVPGLSGSTPYAIASGSFSSTRAVDSLGRTLSAAGNSGQSTTFAYDNNGNLASRSQATSGAPRITAILYDAHDRQTKLTAPDNGITWFGYDVAGNLASVTDPRGLVTGYAYNRFGEVVLRTSPDTGATSYTYDSAGRVTTETRANGTVIGYTWDALNRMTSRVTRLNDATGQTTYTYAADGQLAQQVHTIYGASYTTAWTYNAAGQLTVGCCRLDGHRPKLLKGTLRLDQLPNQRRGENQGLTRVALPSGSSSAKGGNERPKPEVSAAQPCGGPAS